MDHTTNYQLSQWAKSDQVKMEDFNADNAKLDAALKAEADARAAAVNAINTTLSGAVKLAVGRYVGDNAESRTIPLPFTPKAVYVCITSGATLTTGRFYGGLAITGRPAFSAYSGIPYNIVEIVNGGFKVACIHKSDSWEVLSNSLNVSYHYIAFG